MLTYLSKKKKKREFNSVRSIEINYLKEILKNC